MVKARLIVVVKNVGIFGRMDEGHLRVLYGEKGVTEGYYAPREEQAPAEFVGAPTVITLQYNAHGQAQAGQLFIARCLHRFSKVALVGPYQTAIMGECQSDMKSSASRHVSINWNRLQHVQNMVLTENICMNMTFIEPVQFCRVKLKSL